MNVFPRRRASRKLKPTRRVRVLALAGVLAATALAVTLHSASGSAPTPVAGPATITFDHTQIVDPVRLVGEPDIAIDSDGGIYVSGPGSSPTQSSHFWKSEDHGVQWHYVGIIPEEKSNGGLGGGDTELVIDKRDKVWGMDQEGLACNAHFQSEDRGKTWTYSQGCVTGTDRPWMVTYTHPDTGQTEAFFVANIAGNVCYMLRSTDGIVWTLPNHTDPTVGVSTGPGGVCQGRPAIDERNGTIYVPSSTGVRKTTDFGVTWTTAGVSGARGGAGQGGMATLVIDKQGNLYTAWTNLTDVFYSVSTDGGKTWRRTTLPKPAGMQRSIFVWPVVGDPGRVAVAYYATKDGPTSTTAIWRTYVAFSLNGLAATPTFTTVIADEHPMKVGTLCLEGTACAEYQTDPARGDRTLADFFMLDVDRNDGRVYLIINDDGENSTTTKVGKAYVALIRQRTGPSLLASVGNLDPPTTAPVSIGSVGESDGQLHVSGSSGLPPGTWAPDPAGDAVYPWAPLTGPNIAPMDIRESSVSDDGTTLIFKIRVADLFGVGNVATDIGGVPSWVVTWWQNRSDVAKPFSQARFFVKWLGGTNFVYGQTGAIEMPQLGAPAPKFVTFVPAGNATGSVNGDTITTSVPKASVGNPQPGDKLDQVTAATWDERGEIPTIVDQAPGFSYRFGTPAEKQHASDGYVEASLDDATFANSVRVAPAANGAWTADFAQPTRAGHHTVFVRQVLSSDLYEATWPDVQAGSVVQSTFVDRLPKVSIGNATIAEGTGSTSTASFTVSLSEPSTDDVSVAYATSSGTAVWPGDYTDASGRVTIPAGQTSVSVPVQVDGDSEPEPNETFSIDISAPTNATLDTAHAVGTITNDDGSMGCTISGTEGDDVLTGTNANDVICGFGGADVIRGSGGNDILIGGAGRDVLYGEAGQDVLRGQEGNDLLDGGSDNDTLIAYVGKDTLTGGYGADSLNAKDGVGDDSLDGGNGTDTCASDSGDVVKSC
jgi:Ca2+-binding RTX toxin-like protein